MPVASVSNRGLVYFHENLIDKLSFEKFRFSPRFETGALDTCELTLITKLFVSLVTLLGVRVHPPLFITKKTL